MGWGSPSRGWSGPNEPTGSRAPRLRSEARCTLGHETSGEPKIRRGSEGSTGLRIPCRDRSPGRRRRSPRPPAPIVSRSLHRQHVGVVPLRAPRPSRVGAQRGRTPGTLLAAIDTPVPVQHHTMPRSARPSATAAPTPWPTSGHGAPWPTTTSSCPASVTCRSTASVTACDLVGADGDAHQLARCSGGLADHRSGLSSTRCSITRPSIASTSTRPRRAGGSSAE